jgi:hypothetical protein
MVPLRLRKMNDRRSSCRLWVSFPSFNIRLNGTREYRIEEYGRRISQYRVAGENTWKDRKEREEKTSSWGLD